MKKLFLALLALILFAACSTEEDITLETNEFIETHSTIATDRNQENEVEAVAECYALFFPPSMYTEKSIAAIIETGVRRYIDIDHDWVLADRQPDLYPYLQYWCKGLPLPPNGEEEETDPPIGVTITPLGGYGG